MKAFKFILAAVLITLFTAASGAAGGCVSSVPAVSVAVSFDLEGGSVGGQKEIAPITVTIGGKHGALPSPEKAGSVFEGWHVWSCGEASKVDADTIVKYNADYTLYAVWTAQPYTVSFDLNGGTGAAPDKTVYCGEKYGALPSAGIEKEGCILTGWETEDGAPVTGADYVETEGNRILYAVWLEAEWVVLNGFEYSNSSQIINSGITGQTRVDPWNTISILQNHGLSSNNSVSYKKQGSYSLQAMLYGDKPASTDLNWKPSVKIPKSSFASAYKDYGFGDMRVLETDIFFVGSGSNCSSERSAMCTLMLCAGEKRMILNPVELLGEGTGNNANGWNKVRFDLSLLTDEQLAAADAIVLEFPNNRAYDAKTVFDRGYRYRFYIDNLRAVLK